MKLVLTTLVVSFGSAVLPFVNIEAYLAAVGAAVDGGVLWGIAAAAAVGQTAGKVLLYYAAEWAMNLPWLQEEDGPAEVAGVVRPLAGAGQRPTPARPPRSCSPRPPRLPAALRDRRAGRAAKVNIWLFVSTCLVGRFLRFLALVGARGLAGATCSEGTASFTTGL